MKLFNQILQSLFYLVMIAAAIIGAYSFGARYEVIGNNDPTGPSYIKLDRITGRTWTYYELTHSQNQKQTSTWRPVMDDFDDAWSYILRQSGEK